MLFTWSSSVCVNCRCPTHQMGPLLTQLGYEAEQIQFQETAPSLFGQGGCEDVDKTRPGPLHGMWGGTSLIAHCPRWHSWSAAIMVFGAHILALVCWQCLVGLLLLAGGFHSWPALWVLHHPCEVCSHFCVGFSIAIWVAARQACPL